jgi:allantoin racemase
MSKILYLVPLVGFTEEEKTRREKLANSFLTQGKNEVVVEDIEEGPISIESSIEEYMCVGGMLKKLVAVQNKYDAAIIGCAGDPGLVPAKELVDIPIIGPLEASLHVASMLGETFTVIPSSVSTISRKLRYYGMEHKLASAEGIHFPCPGNGKEQGRSCQRILKKREKGCRTGQCFMHYHRLYDNRFSSNR